ncbi:jerky protein homolog-like [Diabrotica virgifera virgifera]|uniref:DDE-1 domain-containing protein n=1 Tax=Diabrotica virgifera virgifera TaxID=50390 RepID=A0ABM5KGD5_DIAVI|nr:jerky protein homolog-like [Diabrotica virgifera virgifera]
MRTSYARVQGFNRPAVKEFFDLLEVEYTRKNYSPDRVYNVDETGLTIVQSKVPQVIGRKGKRQIGALTAAERGSLVTLVCAMSAGGTFIAPMLIFPRKNFSDVLMKGALPGAIGRVHPSGWIETNLFSEWFNHFVSKTNPTEDSPLLLILDGHYSHTRNIAVLEVAREKHVTIISLPPHTTHKLQPLDKTFMSPLKSHYSEEIRKFLLHSDRMVKPHDVAELFGKAYLKCATAEIAVNGFKVTGIYPFNPQIFKDADFLAASQSLQLEEENISSSSTTLMMNPTESSVETATLTIESSRQPTSCTVPESSIQLKSCAPSTSTSDSVSLQPKSSSEHGRLLTIKPSVFYSKPGTSSAVNPSLILPYQISPIPKPKIKTSNRGRKSTKATVITSSPYKFELEQSLKKTEDRKQSCGRGRGRGRGRICKKAQEKVRKRITVEDSDTEESDLSNIEEDTDSELSSQGSIPDNDDAVCIFCEESYSSNSRGETWIKCQSCLLWAHNECAGAETEHYMCDFCR